MNDLSLREAFEETDAICRKFSMPTTRQSYFRALARLALGDREGGLEDLRKALEGPSDPDVLNVYLRLCPDRSLALAAFSLTTAGDGLLRLAAAIVLRTEPVVMKAERTRTGLYALVATRAGIAPLLSIDREPVHPGEVDREEVGEMAFHRIRRALPSGASSCVEAKLGRHVRTITVPPREMRITRPGMRNHVVSVVVPIHGGRDVTRSCLGALALQRCRRDIEVVIVDDACPDPQLAAEVAATAAMRGWRCLRNASNLGFAASVNTGAALCSGADILLLNADAILPPGAIDRLLDAAAEPGVGTVVPLTNDGVFTSFPTMSKANPAPDEEEAIRIDAVAQRAARSRAIDIPAGTAFCMLVNGGCWDALGGLDLGYGRGYFEDVDLCLRAKRLGFRNVLAPAVYVLHLGGQSFGSVKKSLVADNARLLFERFPDYDVDWMAFTEGDPLAAVRDGIERLLPPSWPVHIVAGREACPESLATIAGLADAADGARLLVIEEKRDGRRRLRGVDGSGPQTLQFGPHETVAFASYVGALRISGVSLLHASEALLRELESVLPAHAPVWLPLTGPRSLEALHGRPGLLGRARAQAWDRMGRAALGERVDPLPQPHRPDTRPPRLAALVPRPTVAVDRVLLALDQRLRARGGEVVVVGEAASGRARPVTTGAMASGEYPGALRHRGITHVLLPDVDTPFRLVEELRRACPLPAAYIDWAPGRHRAAPGDLALRADESDEHRISSVVSWCCPGVWTSPRGTASSPSPAARQHAQVRQAASGGARPGLDGLAADRARP